MATAPLSPLTAGRDVDDATSHGDPGRRIAPLTIGTVSISRLTARLGLTARALRHYEEIGLIVPSRGWGGVRHYRHDTVVTIELIVQLRAVDVCLAEIRMILSEVRPQERDRLIHKILGRLASARRQNLKDIERVLAQIPLHSAEAPPVNAP